MNAYDFVRTIIKNRGLVPQKSVGFAFAPTNIALVKYWGKRNTILNLPMTSSLSVTLPEKGAFTSVRVIEKSADDIFLNGQSIASDKPFAKRLIAFLDFFRSESNIRFSVETQMNIPASAGLASSACGFAALVLALDDLFDWQLDKTSLSLLARLGSGSACRSLWPGFVEWHAGQDEEGMDSYAEPLGEQWEELCMALLMVNGNPKSISSRDAMQQTSETSCYYPAWLDKVAKDLPTLKQAIKKHDFELFGKTVEGNALAMHAAILTTWPPIFYGLPESIDHLQKVWRLRKNGLEVYVTQDAGPNIKLLFLSSELKRIQMEFPGIEIIRPFSSKASQNQVILVDEQDRTIGFEEKIKAHEKALCHRAFSVFIFRRREGAVEVLLQQRQHNKYHCGGLWTNTCCSHPRPGDSLIVAAEKRLEEEMGIKTKLYFKGSFHYVAPFGNGLTENEIDHVLIGFADTETVKFNSQEVADYRWVPMKTLQKDLGDNPKKYTPWLAEALEIAYNSI